MGHLAPHQYVPLWPSERAEMAAQEQAAVARDGERCMTIAENIAAMCDRKPHRWDVRDGKLIESVLALLIDAEEIMKRVEK